MIRPYKFQIVAICQEVNADGDVIAERPVASAEGQPVEVFGVNGLREFAETFEAKLRASEAEAGPK